MNKDTHKQYDTEEDIIKVLAHPVRIFIIDALLGMDKSAHELGKMTGLSMDAVCEHLDILADAGIIHEARRDSRVYFHLNSSFSLDYINSAETFMKTKPHKSVIHYVKGRDIT